MEFFRRLLFCVMCIIIFLIEMSENFVGIALSLYGLLGCRAILSFWKKKGFALSNRRLGIKWYSVVIGEW